MIVGNPSEILELCFDLRFADPANEVLEAFVALALLQEVVGQPVRADTSRSRATAGPVAVEIDLLIDEAIR